MGVKVLRTGYLEGAPPVPNKAVGPLGQQLCHLAGEWPEVTAGGSVIGIYQAMAEDRVDIHEGFYAQVEVSGFESFRTSSLIFEHLVYGPFAMLAIANGCQGPFWTIAGDELSGTLAFWTAYGDLKRGRCDRALVGSFDKVPERSWLSLIEPGDVDAAILHLHGVEVPQPEHLAELADRLGGPVSLLPGRNLAQDPHGSAAILEALQRAASGNACAVWSLTSDGRGTLLGFRRSA